jgi:hypothetical protein
MPWSDLQALIASFREPRPQGQKEVFRPTDRIGKSLSPIKTANPPLARMFQVASPMLLAGDWDVLPMRQTGSDRVVVEVYPKLVAEAPAARCIEIRRGSHDLGSLRLRVRLRDQSGQQRVAARTRAHGHEEAALAGLGEAEQREARRHARQLDAAHLAGRQCRGSPPQPALVDRDRAPLFRAAPAPESASNNGKVSRMPVGSGRRPLTQEAPRGLGL